MGEGRGVQSLPGEKWMIMGGVMGDYDSVFVHKLVVTCPTVFTFTGCHNNV